MGERKDEKQESDGYDVRSATMRSIKLTLLVFGLLLGGIAIAAWVSDDDTDLPFVYDGFD